jgi:hypothetical protein
LSGGEGGIEQVPRPAIGIDCAPVPQPDVEHVLARFDRKPLKQPQASKSVEE